MNSTENSPSNIRDASPLVNLATRNVFLTIKCHLY
jgi:hypothetical protein